MDELVVNDDSLYDLIQLFRTKFNEDIKNSSLMNFSIKIFALFNAFRVDQYRQWHP